MPFIWHRDYSDKTDDELRQLAGSHDGADRAELLRRLIARDAKRFWAVWGSGLALWLILNLLKRSGWI